jgi:ATP-dependent DNA helicase RecQ
VSEDAIRELARTRLGFERLRPGQLRAVAAASEGRDVLAVLPTGGGKSAIYELAGLMLDGPTVVVSPLIALQDRPARASARRRPLRDRAELAAVVAGAGGGARRVIRVRQLRLPLAGAADERGDKGGAAAGRSRGCSSSTRRI